MELEFFILWMNLKKSRKKIKNSPSTSKQLRFLFRLLNHHHLVRSKRTWCHLKSDVPVLIQSKIIVNRFICRFPSILSSFAFSQLDHGDNWYALYIGESSTLFHRYSYRLGSQFASFHLLSHVSSFNDRLINRRANRCFVFVFRLANNRTYFQRDKNRMRIWFPFFTYFEENVKQAIPNEYCLPTFIGEARTKMHGCMDRLRYPSD